MTALAHRRARIARVRHVQHLQAAGAAAQAESRLETLEGNADRLAGLRISLLAAYGTTDGAALANAGELAMRLDEAAHALDRAIDDQQRTVSLRLAERLGARIAQESAERLQVRAVAEMQRLIEERMAAGFRPRTLKVTGNG